MKYLKSLLSIMTILLVLHSNNSDCLASSFINALGFLPLSGASTSTGSQYCTNLYTNGGSCIT